MERQRMTTPLPATFPRAILRTEGGEHHTGINGSQIKENFAENIRELPMAVQDDTLPQEAEEAVSPETPSPSPSLGVDVQRTELIAELVEEDALCGGSAEACRPASSMRELPLVQAKPSEPLPLFKITLPKVEDRCSLAPAMDILSYSGREWKGKTAKSALIRKGYKEMSRRFGSLRRVRGDNYCALRATLFQVLSNGTRLPAWLQREDFTTLPKQLEARDGLLVSRWIFPKECRRKVNDETGDAARQLTLYMEQLRNRWQAAAGCSSAAGRHRLCEQVFQGGEEELGLLEALKLLMLARAVELHQRMQGGGEVPVFCWLLYGRDSSPSPRDFLSNHLSHVGFGGGLEQVEMFLLGYTLQCTIQVYRLYMVDSEEFLTYYPDDHKDDWPSVCLVTEDDRHYNVPVNGK